MASPLLSTVDCLLQYTIVNPKRKDLKTTKFSLFFCLIYLIQSLRSNIFNFHLPFRPRICTIILLI